MNIVLLFHLQIVTWNSPYSVQYNVPNWEMREFSQPISVNRKNSFENETKQINLATSQKFSFFLLFISSDVVSWISTLNYPPNDPIKYFSFFPFDVMVVLCSFDVHLYTHTHTIWQFLSQTFSSFYFSSSQTLFSCAARWSQKFFSILLLCF